MKNEVLYSLPMILGDKCPVCQNKITQHKSINIQNYQCDALFCVHCNIPFASTETMKVFWKETLKQLPVFAVSKKASATSIINKIHYKQKSKKPPNLSLEAPKFPFEIRERSIINWKTPKSLQGIDSDIDKCPQCFSVLLPDYSLIPISKTKEIKVPGQLCDSCKVLYVRRHTELKKIMLDNPFTEAFVLDGVNLSIYSETKRQKKSEAKRIEKKKMKEERKAFENKKKHKYFMNIPSSVVMITIAFSKQEITDVIIVNDLIQSNIKENIFHYRDSNALELLSAAFAPQKNKTGIYNGRSYRVKEIYPHRLPECVLPTQLFIREGGGLSSSVKNKSREIVEVLLYSPYTKKYEIIKATYDKQAHLCYTDAFRFREFLHKFGNPQICLCFDNDKMYIRDWSELPSESILKIWGYTVNKSDNLSALHRQKLLADIIDIEILTPSQILKHLEWCTQRKSSKYIEARHKWEEDMNFVKNYKVNPTRFLIAQCNGNII